MRPASLLQVAECCARRQAGHIEDVVVDSSYRGAQLGKRCAAVCHHLSLQGRGGGGQRNYWSLRCRLIAEATRLAEQAGCYKVILDCSEDNVSFYTKCDLKRKDVQMVRPAAPRRAVL